jgi:xanthine dehydrogenase YagR molybdenum-binding subunit
LPPTIGGTSYSAVQAVALEQDPLLRCNYAERDRHEIMPFVSKTMSECYRQAAEAFGWSRHPLCVAAM